MLRPFPLRPVILAMSLCLISARSAGSVITQTPEQQLLDAVQLMQEGDADAARKSLRALTRRHPDFRLAHLVYGELLNNLSGNRLETPLNNAADPLIHDLTEEGRFRLVGTQTLPPEGSVPDAILKLAPQQPYVVVVDLSRARLYLFHNDKNGQLKLIRQNYAAMGRKGFGKQATGDLRTPLGVYRIKGWLDGRKLPELYGAGALPLDYPNLWDQFRQYSGNGIWLHGVPSDTYVRAPRSSEGCITMANEDLLALRPYVAKRKTPVVISDQLQWLTPEQSADERNAFLSRIEDWHQQWAAGNAAAYRQFYGEEYSSDALDNFSFAAHKLPINPGKHAPESHLSDLNVLRYPGTGSDMVLAEFKLHYRSGAYTTVSQKQQFWRREAGGSWKIYREESRQ